MPRGTTSPNRPLFAVWLARTRGARGLTQGDIAERAGVSQEYVSGLERGTRNPSRKVIASLATALAPDGAGADVPRGILNEGLRAAGFLPPEELTPDPYLDEIREAGYSELPVEARAVIVEHIRLRREEERRRRGGESGG
ncbi:MAG: helix-turn-helix transcriptional regulator [Armatimonadetes bacterium]|nr:helix-turn-helix transcriptional regulator [Armatimonadota bacterium]